MTDLREVAKKYQEKLSKIKVFLSDVDGVLTNGLIHYDGEEVGFNRSFHSQDGYGMKILMQAGLKVGVISGGDSLSVKKRMDYLGLDFIYLGNEDKRGAYTEILEKTGVKDEEVLYIGDDLFDIPVLKRVGFSVTVPHAGVELQEVCDYTTSRDGGMACVREVCDMVRYAQNHPSPIIDFE